MKRLNIPRIKEILSRYKDHHIKVFSAQMAYFLLLSIFPFVVFVMSLASRMNLNIDVFISDLHSRLPEGSTVMIDELIRNYLVNNSIALLIASGIFTFWSVSRSVNALMKSFNKAYGHKETRGFLRIWATAILVTLSLIILILVSITLPSLGKGFFDYLGNFIDLPSYAYNVFSLLRTAITIATYIVVILLIHTILPAGNLKARDVIYGSIFSILGWTLISKGFNYFASLFTNYALVYGGLASFVILMIWMYFASTILMLGAEINSTIRDYRNKNFPFDKRT
jgi:membrane protein